jgi:hypothetical protein
LRMLYCTLSLNTLVELSSLWKVTPDLVSSGTRNLFSHSLPLKSTLHVALGQISFILLTESITQIKSNLVIWIL